MTVTSGLSIGKATELLREEFPDLTMSKMRFLETRGLVAPSRSSAGYRQYRSSDVERLRFILRQQRDHFLPLKVIKSQLGSWERGEVLHPEEESPEDPPDLSGSDEPVFELREFSQRSGVSRSDTRQLVRYGLLAPQEEDGILRFSNRDLAVSRHCGVLIEMGLEARHLRMIRSTVSRQVELIGQLTVAQRRSRNPEARRHAEDIVNRGIDAMRQINDALFVTEARTILGED